MGIPHVLAIPFPAQGHVIPLMNLSQNLAKQALKITFNVAGNSFLQLVSIPDGLEDGEDRNQLGKLTERINQVMPGHLKELIHKINALNEDKITCVLADLSIGFVVDVAVELEIPTAGFWPASMFQLVMLLSIPKHIEDGWIDENGTPLIKDKVFQLSPMTPAIHPTNFVWCNIESSPSTQKIIFHTLRGKNKAVESVDWVLCNSSLELEPEGFNLVPQILPIGPLSAVDRLGNLSGNFWPEDPTCLQWLDQQPPASVIYVAFGSFTVLTKSSSKSWLWGLNWPTGHFFGPSEKILQRGNTMFTHRGLSKEWEIEVRW
ncbi:UDP-glycosyltransferase 83A1-like [Hibiscus syriacus]|uniref:UDP-glycosyltransferase 83A1-like n=1 Tax=Hibiscus syriacus TaxID=106335 RepID=A0A6A3A2Q4_HIBSY|nr:UDP-glycosyltransferase 83A1-like [Hibiscus syriacus]